MTTYDIKVNGVTVLEKIEPSELEESIRQVEGVMFISGKGKREDISVVLNTENP